MIHYLKTHPEPYRATAAGQKTHEFRQNDRKFKVGDLLVLKEYVPEVDQYTGDSVHRG